MAHLDVDVVIPLYNKGPYIAQAVRSALGQSHAPRSVIVADDASTDGGREAVAAIAADDQRVRLLVSDAAMPRGAGSARNRAVRETVAEFVAFLDADDFWNAEKLAAQLPVMADPAIGTVHCGARVVTSDGRCVAELYPPPPPPPSQIFDEIRLGRYSVTGSSSAVLTRRSLLERAGPFSDEAAFAEDWDMWVRLAALSGFVAVPRLLTNIRALPTRWQSSSDAERFARWLGLLDRWKDDETFMQRAEAEVRGIVARHQAGLLLHSPRRAFVDYPREVLRHGGVLGQRLFGTRSARAFTSGTMLPALALRASQKALRSLSARRRAARVG
ncbi:MAG TPA: glycosyltransferase [Devosia sp.]|nr:glycosyltransferase [Devosia sp.]